MAFMRTECWALLAATTLLWPLPASAGLYCCNDDTGKRICGDSLPKSCVGQGYTVKEKGKSMRTVAPPLTPEEQARAAAEAERRKAEEAAAKQQALKDQALLATYSNEADIDAAQKRAEADLAQTIKQAEAKIAAAAKRKQKFDADAEFYKNKPLPPEIARGLKDVEFEEKAQRELIATKEKDMQALRDRFEAERTRYRGLRNGAIPLPKAIAAVKGR